MPRVGEKARGVIVLHVMLADLPLARHCDIALRWPVDMRRVRGKRVRVVYDDASAMRPVLRALCAADCDVELLDIDEPRWSFVSYDKSAVRRGLRAQGLPVLDPMAISMSRGAAYWLIGVLTGAEAMSANREP